MSAGPIILPALGGDLDAVVRIAVACFPVPWTRVELEKELQRDYAVLRVLRPASGQPICAFANYWCIADELQLMNVATLQAQRRRGFGRALVCDMIEDARARRSALVALEVRRSNDAARALYRGLGFVEQGVRPRYYSDNAEDAIVMQLALGSAGVRAP
jgi:[ribosomal protein S18]-alanine N-acetyltransferase